MTSRYRPVTAFCAMEMSIPHGFCHLVLRHLKLRHGVGPWHGGLDLLDMEKGVLDNDPLLSRLGFLLPMRGDGLDGVAHVEKLSAVSASPSQKVVEWLKDMSAVSGSEFLFWPKPCS